MNTYSIGQVEELTGIKAHVLRYWEEVIPAIAPQKDLGNRRVYTTRDIQNIKRLNHLIHVKKYTIEGARSQLIAEAGLVYAAGEQTIALMQALDGLKQSLTSLYFRVKHGEPEPAHD
jgi:DNA-binding transcriptional MerR regulator